MSGRLLALDIGTKRIGVARTDILKLSINPVGTYHVSNFLQELDSLIKSEGPIEAILFGWPLHNGKEGKATLRVQNWMNRIKKLYPDTPMHKIDESYTSEEAHQLQRDLGIPKLKRQDKDRVDAMAAVLILKRFLDENA